MCSQNASSSSPRCLLPAPPDGYCGFVASFPCTAHFACTLTGCTPIRNACNYSCHPVDGPFGPCTVDCAPISTTALPADPCDAFAEAHCAWFERCPHGMFGGSAPYGADCRARFRSMCGLPGQTATPADVVSCARALIDAPCGCSSEYVPQCLALKTGAGTLADAACQVDSQCQSASCNTGVCAPRTQPMGERTCNESCQTDADCAEPFTCIRHVCRPKLRVGQTCVYLQTTYLPDACPDYTYCNAVSPIPGNAIGDCSPVPQSAP